VARKLCNTPVCTKPPGLPHYHLCRIALSRFKLREERKRQETPRSARSPILPQPQNIPILLNRSTLISRRGRSRGAPFGGRIATFTACLAVGSAATRSRTTNYSELGTVAWPPGRCNPPCQENLQSVFRYSRFQGNWWLVCKRQSPTGDHHAGFRM